MAEQQIGVEGQVGHQMGEQLPSAGEQASAGGGTGDSGRVMNSATSACMSYLKFFFG